MQRTIAAGSKFSANKHFAAIQDSIALDSVQQ